MKIVCQILLRTFLQFDQYLKDVRRFLIVKNDRFYLEDLFKTWKVMNIGKLKNKLDKITSTESVKSFMVITIAV